MRALADRFWKDPDGYARFRSAEAKKAQDRYHDDYSSNEPNDVVHDLSPVAWGSPRLWRRTRADQPLPTDLQQTPNRDPGCEK
jgi:hypothetical protein